MNTLFASILTEGTFTAAAFLEATACSFAIGLFIAFMYMKSNHYSRSFVITIALLPAIVQMVIMLVNGNIGAGVAVAGAFSLVRFRSAAGSAQEITSIFLAMAVGLATGMGYLTVAIVFAVLVMTAYYLMQRTGFASGSTGTRYLKVSIPENLDFEGVFDDLFDTYTERAELMDVRTAGMGSIYKLTYQVQLRSGTSVKEMMDRMRERNGNLEIACLRETAVKTEEL